MPPLDWEQKLAFDFLDLCMELNPQKRFSAADALQHPFLCAAEEDEGLEDVFLP
jgi:serine/threonine protein kinase